MGVAAVMLRYAVFFMFMMLASIGTLGPAVCGEMLVLVGARKATAGSRSPPGLVLGAAHRLWLYRRVMFGEIVSAEVERWSGSRREVLIFAPLTVLVSGSVYPPRSSM